MSGKAQFIPDLENWDGVLPYLQNEMKQRTNSERR